MLAIACLIYKIPGDMEGSTQEYFPFTISREIFTVKMTCDKQISHHEIGEWDKNPS